MIHLLSSPTFRIFLFFLFVTGVVPAGAQSVPELKPFVLNHRPGAESRIDLSFLLEAPAGKNGFVRVQDGRLVLPNGEPARLWGVNITDWTRGSVQLPTKEESVFWARTLARFGVNVVRLTFLDFLAPRGLIDASRNDTRQLDAAQLDKLDFWIAELKKNGIYTDLNLLVGRNYKAGDGVQDHAQVGWAKYASYFDPRLIQLQKEFAHQLLTHRNPYTQTEYRQEPAIVIVELVNENTLFDAWERDALHPTENPGRDPNFRNLTPYHADLLTRQFNAYLQQHKTPEERNLIAAQAGVQAGQPVPRIRKADYATAPKELFQATVAFYMQTERDFFDHMKSYLKDTLGVQSLLLGSNDFLHNQPQYPMVWSNAALDMQDGHVYWQHPSWPGNLNTPMVNDPDSSTVVKLSRTALAGMPYTVTEVNNAFPSDYEAEGIPIIAAYGRFQGWDAIMWYTFEPKADPAHLGYVGDAFDISHHPVKMPQLAAGALMYLRGDVSEAKETVSRTYTLEQVRESMRLPKKENPYYTPGFPLSLVRKHKMRIGSLEGPATKTYKDTPANPVVSDTKELAWYSSPQKTGLVTVESPRSQALVGFVRANGKSVRNLAADVTNTFCAITLSSLDNEPISGSARLLLTTGGRVENTGQEWNETRTKTSKRGGAPSLIEPITGTITLRNLNRKTKRVQVTALDGAGRAMGAAVNAKKTSRGWEFPIGTTVTTWYEITVEKPTGRR